MSWISVSTPQNIDIVQTIYRDPVTGQLIFPILSFDTKFNNPLYYDIDPLNNDPYYHNRLIEHIYLRLTEKWLYKDADFKKLLKYFNVEVNGNKGTVSLIANPDELVKTNEDKKKYIFRYIEKVFISKKFVAKVIKQYVATTHIKWYDLLANTDSLKELFAHKLKKVIIASIYEMNGKKVIKK